VGLTTPSSGAVVSNIVSLAATASDNVGVVGVKLFANGAELVDDTASP